MSSESEELVDMIGEGGKRKRCARPGWLCVCCGAVLVGALVLCVLAPLLYVEVLQPFINQEVEENVLLTNGSVGLSQFVSSKAPLFSEYYMFTITNADDVKSNAAVPNVEQIGPFVYRENRTKTGLWWEGHKDSTGAAATGNEVLGFNLLINYTFQPHLSNGLNPNTTLITVPNLPLMGVLVKLMALDQNSKVFKYVLELVDLFIEEALSGEGLFVTKTVHQLLWGYTDNLLSKIKKLEDLANRMFKTHINIVDSDVFGLGKLSGVEAPNRVFTGVGNISKVGEFVEWNNHTSIAGWNSTFAREIRGTGGFMFHPGVTREENLTSFISELYRSGYFSFQYDSDVHGVQLYNFGLPREELVNTSQDPGFYPNGPSGVLNISCVVQANVPLFVSKPHFLDADPDYLKNISGLHPDRAEHDSYVGVEPITGEVLDAAKKLQVNLRLTRFSALPHLSSLRDVTMLPVYWVSQTGTIPANLAAEFAAKVYGVEDGIRGGVYAVTGLAGLLVVVSLLCVIRVGVVKWCGRGRKPFINRRQNINDTEQSPLLNNNY